MYVPPTSTPQPTTLSTTIKGFGPGQVTGFENSTLYESPTNGTGTLNNDDGNSLSKWVIVGIVAIVVLVLLYISSSVGGFYKKKSSKKEKSAKVSEMPAEPLIPAPPVQTQPTKLSAEVVEEHPVKEAANDVKEGDKNFWVSISDCVSKTIQILGRAGKVCQGEW